MPGAPSTDTPAPATKTATPTVEATLDSSQPPVFSLSGASQELPENVIDEMMFFGGAGGSSDPCEAAPKNSLSVPGADANASMYIFGYGYKKGCVDICGWKQDEPIQFTMTAPDGDVTTTSGQATFYGRGIFCPEFVIDSPLGSYLLRAQGESGEIETTFEVVKPDKPTLSVTEGQLILYAFSPNEKVRVFAYSSEGFENGHKFVGWQEYQVDEDGKLAIELPVGNDLAYYAIGEVSGEASYQGLYHGSVTCAGTSPSPFQPGMQAQVTSKNAHLYPDTPLTPLDTLLYGTVVEITGGPGCIDGTSYYWRVKLPDGRAGSVEEYVLSPEIDPSLVPSEMTCDGAMPTRFNIGMHGRTTYSSKLPLQLYKDAGFSKKIRAELPAGTEFDITHGPACADHTIWWKVMTADGNAGWTPESKDGEYLIQPWN
jgi:hypothetical protein